MRIDHVQLAAPPGAEPAARRFYGELLGLEELPKPAPLAVRGGFWFALPGEGGGQIHIGIEADFRPARKAHVALRLPSEDALWALYAHLEKSGVAVRKDTELPGVARFYADDPWGNRLELVG
jgi:catechol 2,3-dioxygenase-like lactoylglutathione lyase family enzyme